MKVSIILPVYNVEKYIKECLDSLVNQSYKNIEIIVVNDGSPDNSQKIIDEYSKEYKEVKSYTKENGGVSSARNLGLDKATGDYVMFVDGDDYVSKDIISKLIEDIKKEKCDIACSDIIKFYEDGKETYYKTNQNYSDNDIKNYIIGDSGPCAKLFKKELFDKVKFRKLAYEDLDIIPILAINVNKIGYIKEGLYYYRQIDGSATRLSKYNESMLDIFTVLENVYDKLNNKYPEEVEYIYISHLLRTTTLRMIDFKETKQYLHKIIAIMKEKFVGWKNNVYYKKSSKKMKIICNLAYYKQWWILKIIKRIANK